MIFSEGNKGSCTSNRVLAFWHSVSTPGELTSCGLLESHHSAKDWGPDSHLISDLQSADNKL